MWAKQYPSKFYGLDFFCVRVIVYHKNYRRDCCALLYSGYINSLFMILVISLPIFLWVVSFFQEVSTYDKQIFSWSFNLFLENNFCFIIVSRTMIFNRRCSRYCFRCLVSYTNYLSSAYCPAFYILFVCYLRLLFTQLYTHIYLFGLFCIPNIIVGNQIPVTYSIDIVETV